MKCPNCGTKNVDGAKYCIRCQHKLDEVKKRGFKICPKCNKKYTSEAEYCVLCQTKLEYAKKSKKPIIIISSIAAVLVVAVSVSVGIYLYPRIMLSKAIARGDTDKIVDISEKHHNLILEEKYRTRYIILIGDTLDDYIDEIVDYSSMEADFLNFEKVDEYSHDDEIEEIIDEDETIAKKYYDSREAYNLANEFYQNADYEPAEENYGEVIKEDKKYYDLAQKTLEDIEDLKESYLINSDKELTNENFDGCIDTLMEGITIFGYDEKYLDSYHNKIAECVISESDYLIGKECYFTYNDELGAFNLVEGYLTDENYVFSDSVRTDLKNKLNDIVAKSETSEINRAVKGLNLGELSDELNTYSAEAAKDYFTDRTINDNDEYINSHILSGSTIQDLVADIPIEKKLHVMLVTDYATPADDFVKLASEKTAQYSGYKWDYTGVARYYDEESMSFTWAAIIIYEME